MLNRVAIAGLLIGLLAVSLTACCCCAGVPKPTVAHAAGNISDRAEMLLLCHSGDAAAQPPGGAVAGAPAMGEAAAGAPATNPHCTPEKQQESLGTIKAESDGLKALAEGKANGGAQ